MIQSESIKTDVLITGSEAAGARAALESARRGQRVIIMTKNIAGMSGVSLKAIFSASAAFGFTEPQDNVNVHLKDTVIAGRMLNNQRLARIVCSEGPRRLDELGKWGVRWDKAPDGRYQQVKLYGHTYPRSLSVGFKIGREWIRVLIKKIKEEPLITLMNDMFIIDYLLSNRGQVCGALVYDIRKGKFIIVKAKAVIDATGGAMHLFNRNSATPESTGDGLAMAFRVGAKMVDMEFMQFYPIELYWPPLLKDQSIPAFARMFLRAHLYNCNGERFMARYEPKEMELADRDILSRAIYREIKEGRCSEHGGVYLSATHLPKSLIDFSVSKHAPGWKMRGIDLIENGLDLRTAPRGRSYGTLLLWRNKSGRKLVYGVPGLYAAGEVTGGVNGANRLPGNTLVETQVSGAIAGEQAALYAQNMEEEVVQYQRVEKVIACIKKMFSNKIGLRPIAIMDELRDMMWQDVGIIRDKQGLERALKRIRTIRNVDLNKISISGSLVMNSDLREALELKNMLDVAEMMTEAALMRTETRGTHTRDDYPDTSEKWLKNIVIENNNGSFDLNLVPVEAALIPLEG